MTREKEIEQAADKHFAHGWYGSVMDAFAEGAQWADQHPKGNLVDIDNVCDWINDNYFEYLQPISYREQLKDSIDIADFVNDCDLIMNFYGNKK